MSGRAKNTVPLNRLLILNMSRMLATLWISKCPILRIEPVRIVVIIVAISSEILIHIDFSFLFGFWMMYIICYSV